MKCPNCHRENYEGAKFCVHCGAPQPKPPSRGRRFFSALIHALLYYMFFYVMQSIVIGVYEAALIVGEMSDSLLNSYLYDGTIPGYVYERLIEQLQENVHLLLILSAAITLLILSLTFRLRHKNPLDEMAIRPAPPSKMACALVLGVALQFFVTLTMAFLPIPEALIESFNENNELLYGGPLTIELISVVLVTPILEEVIFRGLVFTRLRRGMPIALAMAFAAVIFGAAHGHIISLVYAGCLGLLLSLLMLQCGDSILVPICCHMGFNGGSYLLQSLLGDTESLPLLLSVYLISIALTVFVGYAIFRKPSDEIA